MPKKKSNSKVLKCIVRCLEEKRFPHVLFWKNRSKMIFSVVFVHRNNPTWKPSDLDLFKELDKLSNKNYDLNKPEYEKECKVRCKSNLKKLCTEGTLVQLKENRNFYDKSKFSDPYKIKDPYGTYRALMKNVGGGYRENPDWSFSSSEDSGNKSCMDKNEANFLPLNFIPSPSTNGTFIVLESSNNTYQGINLNENEGRKNISEWESKRQLIMDTGNSIQGNIPDKPFTSVGTNEEFSFYPEVENYDVKKVYLSDSNSSEAANVFSPETSYVLNVTEENVEYLKLPNMNEVDAGIPNMNYVDAGIPNMNYSDAGIPNMNYAGVGIPNMNYADAGKPNMNYADAGIHNMNYVDAGIPYMNYADAGIPNMDIDDGGENDFYNYFFCLKLLHCAKQFKIK